RGRKDYRSWLSLPVLPEQLESALRLRVGQRENLLGRGREDLRAGQFCRLADEVRVTDDRLGGRGVLGRDAEAADRGADRVLLERAQTTAERSDVADRRLDHVLRFGDVTVDDVQRATGAEVGEEVGVVAVLRATEVADLDVLNTQADLAGDVHATG